MRKDQVKKLWALFFEDIVCDLLKPLWVGFAWLIGIVGGCGLVIGAIQFLVWLGLGWFLLACAALMGVYVFGIFCMSIQKGEPPGSVL